jgi:hypothetical protein
MNNSSQYRALAPEYHAQLEEGGGWPGNKYTRDWIAKHCKASSEIATRIRQRRYVDEKHAIAFITMLADEYAHEQTRRAREITLAYLKPWKIASLSVASLHASIEYLLTPPLANPPLARRSQGIDFLAGQWHRFTTWMHGDFDERCVRGCPTRDVPRIAEWVFTRVAQSTPGVVPSDTRPVMIEQAARIMATTYNAYVEHAQAWVTFNPWSVVRAWHRDKEYGTLIALPVTEHAYDEIVSGRKLALDCTPSDLCRPTSRHIVLEAAAEQPEELRITPVDKLTWPMYVALAYQLAALTRCNLFHEPTTLHFASFAGTETNRDRLRRAGYKPTGTKTPSRMDVYKRDLKVGTMRSNLHLDAIPLLTLGPVAPAYPRLDGG